MVRNKPKSKLHAILPVCKHHRKHQGVLRMLSYDACSFPPGFFQVEGGRKFHPVCCDKPGDILYPKIEISNITAFITRPTDVGICQLAWTI